MEFDMHCLQSEEITYHESVKRRKIAGHECLLALIGQYLMHLYLKNCLRGTIILIRQAF